MSFLKNTINKIQNTIQEYDMDKKVSSLRIRLEIESTRAKLWMIILKSIASDPWMRVWLDTQTNKKLDNFANGIENKINYIQTIIDTLKSNEWNLVKLSQNYKALLKLNKNTNKDYVQRQILAKLNETKDYYTYLSKKIWRLSQEVSVFNKELEEIIGAPIKTFAPKFD